MDLAHLLQRLDELAAAHRALLSCLVAARISREAAHHVQSDLAHQVSCPVGARASREAAQRAQPDLAHRASCLVAARASREAAQRAQHVSSVVVREQVSQLSMALRREAPPRLSLLRPFHHRRRS